MTCSSVHLSLILRSALPAEMLAGGCAAADAQQALPGDGVLRRRRLGRIHTQASQDQRGSCSAATAAAGRWASGALVTPSGACELPLLLSLSLMSCLTAHICLPVYQETQLLRFYQADLQLAFRTAHSALASVHVCKHRGCLLLCSRCMPYYTHPNSITFDIVT